MDNSLKALQANKTPFLNSVEEDVRKEILGRGADCIAIVERDSEGKVYCTWYPELDDLIDFCKVLFLFVRKKKHRGRPLDSVLTDPIVKIVTKRYQQFYEENADAVSTGLLDELARDDIVLESVVGRLADKVLQKSTSAVRKRVVHIVVDQVHDSAANGALHSIGTQISHVAATTAGTQVAVVVTHLLVKLLATHIGAIVAHIVSSTAIQHAIALVAKKVVLVAVGGTVLQFLAAHVGAAVGGSAILWIAAPLLVVYIGYKIATFPEKLSKEVSKSVRIKLAESFEPMNRDILQKVYKEVFNSEKLILAIAKDSEFQEAMKALV